MPTKTHTSAFSDASTQAAALNEWKQKNEAHRETASFLQRKVKQLKSDSETVRKTSQWLQERDRLNREQELCEGNLDALRSSLSISIRDVDHGEREADLAALKSQLLQQLKEVGVLTHSPSRLATANNALLTDLERVAHLREWIALEMKDALAFESSLASSNTLLNILSLLSVDLDTAASKAKQAFAQLCDTYQPSDELQHIFAVALGSAEDEVRAQLTSLPRIDSTTADDDVLRTVCLIIKMGHQARQFSLSAATRAALADRVVAVYPNMMPTQVQQAIDEGLVVRRAQVMGRAALTDYHRSVTSLLSSCESAFLLASLAEGERLEKAAAAQQRNADQANRHARLAEKRASHEAQLRRRRSEAEQQRSAVAAKAEALRAKQAAEFQRRLQLLQAYEAQRALLREKEQALQEAKARAAEEEKAARMKRNEARVDFRRNQEEQRRRERKMQEEEIRSLQLKKQQALERFFASVDKQLGVEADPQRVLKSTSSSAQTESYETLAQATRPSIAGFSDDQIMKDPRVRLYHALLAAGLHTTPYGREVVTRGYRVTPSQMSSENNPLRGEFS